MTNTNTRVLDKILADLRKREKRQAEVLKNTQEEIKEVEATIKAKLTGK